MVHALDSSFQLIRPMDGIDKTGNTPIADGVKRSAIPLQEWRSRFAKTMDILKARVRTTLNPVKGVAEFETAPEQQSAGNQGVPDLTQNAAYRSGGDFKGALFNYVG